MAWRKWFRFVGLVVWVLVGCHRDGGDGQGDAGGAPAASNPSSEIKLVEQLASAAIRSPWSSLAAGDAEPIPGRELLKLDFEHLAERALGWRRTPQARIVPRPDGKGRALRVLPPKGVPVALLVEIEPSSLVRVERARRGAADSVEMVVLELSLVPKDKRPNHPRDLRRALNRHEVAGTHVGLEVLVAQHRFSEEGPVAGWRSSQLDLWTTAETHSLLLLFEGASRPAKKAETFFDDIRIVALAPTVKQRLQIIRDRYQLGEPGSGLAAFGQFLPLPGGKSPGAAVEENFEFRRGLLLPPPTSVQWSLAIPEQARLDFQVGLLKESAPAVSATYRATVGGKVVARGPVNQRWERQSIDLSAFGGQTVGILLETTGDPGAVPVVSNPTIWRARTNADAFPDVFLFAVDTLRADRLSAYGYEKETSPNLEKLAADGVLFEHVLAQSNWTPESFAGLFTSSYAGQHGVVQRLSVLQCNELAAAFRDAGYFTQGIAYKLLLYDMGFERGFDAFFNRPELHLSRTYDIHAGINWAKAEPWLKRYRDRRKLLFFHLNDPHQPFNHRGASLQRFGTVEHLAAHGLSLPILVRGHQVQHGSKGAVCNDCVMGNRFAPWFRTLANELYDGEVYYVDQYLGRFIDALKTMGLYRNSLIVFWSDHGELLTEHDDYIGHGHHRAFNELLRVPLVIKPPASAALAPGRVSSLVRLVDVMPTILDLAGVPAASPVEGTSLVPLMRGEPRPTVPVVSENAHTNTIVVQDSGHKLTLRYNGMQPQERWIGLARDPGEQRPLPLTETDKDYRPAFRQVAAEHLSRTHPGSFLVVTGKPEGPATPIRIVIPGQGVELKPLVGSVSRGRSGTWVIGQPPSGALVAAVRIRADPDAVVRLDVGTQQHRFPAVGRWPRYGDAAVESVTAGVRVRVCHNPVGARETKGETRADELEALRALGYIESSAP